MLGPCLMLIGGFIACTLLAIENDGKKTPEERLQDTIEENTRYVKALEYELKEMNRRAR